MFNLFQFVLLRSSTAVAEEAIISTEQRSQLQQDLGDDRRSPSPLEKMEQSAEQYIGNGDFISERSRLNFAESYDKLAALLANEPPADRSALAAIIQQAFENPVADIAADQRFVDDREKLADSLIAAKLARTAPDAPLALIARDLRLNHLVRREEEDDDALDVPGTIERALAALIVLPGDLLPLPEVEPPAPAARPSEDDGDARKREAGRHQYEALGAAHEFLSRLSGKDLLTHITQPDERREERTEEPPSEREEALIRELRATAAQHGRAAQLDGAFKASVERIQGISATLRPEALERASQTVRTALRDLDLDLERSTLPEAIDRINVRRAELAPLVFGEDGGRVSLIGSLAIPTREVPDFSPGGGSRDG
ncbi:hypothetical protein [Sphingomonas sp.]|uniref:hypothetical protein n=1 Tax=Sphingomonas sp. TaxID=28214 RepID=UPI003D6CD08C